MLMLHFIASSIVFSGANYSDWYIARLSETGYSHEKIVRDGYEVVMGAFATRPFQLEREPLRRC